MAQHTICLTAEIDGVCGFKNTKDIVTDQDILTADTGGS